MTSCSFCHAVSESKLRSCVCGKVSYCNKECQVKDWKNHKSSCPPYTVREAPGKGRGLFATRKITPGKIILEEKPLFTIENTLLVEWNIFLKIDEDTKASILQLHDPADNLKNLDTEDAERLKRYQRMYSFDSEAGKMFRIFNDNAIVFCSESDVYTNTEAAGLYSMISLINHSCNPNVMSTWVKGDVKMKQVRALKVIEKDEEILACYLKERISSKKTRQQTLLKRHYFRCLCSECSLVGEELKENDRMRAEIREKNEKIMNWTLIKDPNRIREIHHNLRRAVKLSQDYMFLLKKLNLQPQIADGLLKTALPVAWLARNWGVTGPDPISIKHEALEYCQKFGDLMMYEYNKMSNECP